MTEAAWLACADPREMFHVVKPRLSRKRKHQLFAVACCRAVKPEFPDLRSRLAIDVAERHADGRATNEELNRARRDAGGAHSVALNQFGMRGASLEWAAESVARIFAFSAAEAVSRAVVNLRVGFSGPDYSKQAELIRDIFGNPFRTIAINPSWLTSTVLALATGIYSEKAFDRMPILADALQDADCDNEDILNHCQQPGEHVKGCWVVDLLLQKP